MWALWLCFLLLSWFFSPSSSESSSCLAVYREGGAPAVFRSPKCPRWSLLPEDLRLPITGCSSALHQGRRRTQEDRLVCAMGLKIPFPGTIGIEEINVGLLAVFDGHNGDEASDIASKLLVEYFLLHEYFLLDAVYSLVLRSPPEKLTYEFEQNFLFHGFNYKNGQISQHLGAKRFEWLPSTREFHKEILKESLLRALRDIDVAFSQEAYRKELNSGSTAVLVLVADGQILTANVGDSKAILCSESFRLPDKANISRHRRQKRHECGAASAGKQGKSKSRNTCGSGYVVKELTKDHHPDRYDEKNRVEAAGGHVMEWAGVYRVNGHLAVSRAIGDMSFKRYGVIATPEVTDWQLLNANDSFLVVASDGVFEKMTTQEVCDFLWDVNVGNGPKSDIIPLVHSLADRIVSAALQKGSVDNMAAIVLPLDNNGTFGIHLDECLLKESFDPSPCGLKPFMYKASSENGAASSTSLLPMEYVDKVMSRFNSLVVEAKPKKLGCFYLSEYLNEKIDYVSPSQNVHQQNDKHNLSNFLIHPHWSPHWECLSDMHWDLYFCASVGTYTVDSRGQCTGPDILLKLLGLLDSIPYIQMISNSSESFVHKVPDFRYVLKKMFDRGSYGEVWSAYHWNCSQYATTRQKQKQTKHFFACDDNLFKESSDVILKRIMVERGKAAYLSGLREKYFGEIFSNASRALMLGVWDFSSFLKTPKGLVPTSEIKRLNTEKTVCFSDSTRNTSQSSSETSSIIHEEGLSHIARFVEFFESEMKEIWLVFRNEGVSLSKLIYTTEEASTDTKNEKDEPERKYQVFHPSSWWYWLRTTEAGHEELRTIMWQLLMAIKSCHDRNITHRDIKPENMIICFEDVLTGQCSREIPTGHSQYRLKMRIIDFGSAIDDFTLKHLYGAGPSRFEQTFEYTAPEALLNSSWFHAPKSVTMKYDLWSVGVVFLELILGSPHVFQIGDRTRALIDQHLEGWSEPIKELAYRLRSYMEMCILIPGSSSQHHQDGKIKDQGGISPASWKCSEESFLHLVRSRDPLKLGFPSIWALRLVRQLLMWHPEDRLSVDDALSHPFFTNDPHSATASEI